MSRKTQVILAIILLGLVGAVAARYAIDKRLDVHSRGGFTTVVFAPEASPETSRSIRVRFDSRVSPDLGWSFRPDITEVTIRPGERRKLSYTAENPIDRVTIGQSIHEVSPVSAAGHFRKIECFCFEQQSLGPRERVTMPLEFEFAPSLPADITAITVTYTFFTPEGAKAYAADMQSRGIAVEADHDHRSGAHEGHAAQ